MRFSATQLRMLQENLSPTMPPMTPPPELVYTQQSQPAQPAQAPCLAACTPSLNPSGRALNFPCALLGPCYALVALFLLCAHLCCSLSAAALGASPLPLLVAAHALAAPHSQLAQALGVLISLLLPPACALPRPDPALLALSLAASLFFALCTPGAGLLKQVACAAPALVVAACAFVVAVEAPQLRRTGWATVAVALCCQAVAATARLRTFEVICALRATV